MDPRFTKENLEEIARAGTRYASWKGAILLLSLDAAVPFRHELGLSDIDLDAVRTVARTLLQETGSAWDYHVNPPDLPERFLRMTEECVGTGAADKLIEWFDETYPVPDVGSCLLEWHANLDELVREWDSADSLGRLPLADSCYTHYRFKIREVVASIAAFHEETNRVDVDTEWDRRVEEALEDYYVDATLHDLMKKRLLVRRLPILRKGFPEEEKDAFEEWWRHHGGRIECAKFLIC